MFSIKKLFKLPTPTELGKETDYLPLDCLNDDNKYSWEDYDRDVKRLYPIKYFLNDTLPDWFRSIKDPFHAVYNFIKYNFIPKYRYHILDLRQPKNSDEDYYDCDSYRYGYSDVRQRMLYAAFNLLTEHVEKELHPLENKISNLKHQILNVNKYDQWEIDSFKFWLDTYTQIAELYSWWKYVRKTKFAQINKYHDLYTLTKNKIDKDHWLKSHEDFDKEEQEMFMKVCNLRESLWT